MIVSDKSKSKLQQRGETIQAEEVRVSELELEMDVPVSTLVAMPVPAMMTSPMASGVGLTPSTAAVVGSSAPHPLTSSSSIVSHVSLSTSADNAVATSVTTVDSQGGQPLPVAPKSPVVQDHTVARFKSLVQGMLVRIQTRVDHAEVSIAQQKQEPAIQHALVFKDLTPPEKTTNSHSNSMEPPMVPDYVSNTSYQLTPLEMEAALVSILNDYKSGRGSGANASGSISVEDEDEEDAEDLSDIREELNEMIAELSGSSTSATANSNNKDIAAPTSATAPTTPATVMSSVDNNTSTTTPTPLTKSNPSVYVPTVPYVTAEVDPDAIQKVIEFHNTLRKRRREQNSKINSTTKVEVNKVNI